MKIRAAFLAVAFGLGLATAVEAAPAPEGTVDMTELLKAAPLPELAMGPETGVTVVEYGSVTCPHCAAFDKTVLPKLKAAYVDTGKVRYIFREFSRNALDVAAFTLARCVGDDKAMATIELLFSTQDKWAFTDNPLEPLLASLRPTGLSRDKAMACLKDNTEINKVRSITETAEKLVKVQGTPTFVIDGKVYGGELSMDDFDQILKPLIK
jgi:protein-disulfide isomerase